VEKRETLACVHVRLESGSDVLQAGKRQALRDAKRVLVGLTAHTAGGRQSVRLVALLVSSMGRKAPVPRPMNRKEERVANQSNHARELGSRCTSPSCELMTT
jgi:hypothetical protein